MYSKPLCPSCGTPTTCSETYQRNPKGWFPKGWVWRMFSRNENQNEGPGTFGCSPGTKTGTRVRSHVPPERKPERGHVCHNHPFAKPPFYLPVNLNGPDRQSPIASVQRKQSTLAGHSAILHGKKQLRE